MGLKYKTKVETFFQTKKNYHIFQSIEEWLEENPMIEVISMTTTRLSTNEYNGEVLVMYKEPIVVDNPYK